MRAVLPCKTALNQTAIDAALNQTWKVQAVFFKLNCSWQFPFKVYLHKIMFPYVVYLGYIFKLYFC